MKLKLMERSDSESLDIENRKHKLKIIKDQVYA